MTVSGSVSYLHLLGSLLKLQSVTFLRAAGCGIEAVHVFHDARGCCLGLSLRQLGGWRHRPDRLPEKLAVIRTKLGQLLIGYIMTA